MSSSLRTARPGRGRTRTSSRRPSRSASSPPRRQKHSAPRENAQRERSSTALRRALGGMAAGSGVAAAPTSGGLGPRLVWLRLVESARARKVLRDHHGAQRLRNALSWNEHHRRASDRTSQKLHEHARGRADRGGQLVHAGARAGCAAWRRPRRRCSSACCARCSWRRPRGTRNTRRGLELTWDLLLGDEHGSAAGTAYPPSRFTLPFDNPFSSVRSHLHRMFLGSSCLPARQTADACRMFGAVVRTTRAKATRRRRTLPCDRGPRSASSRPGRRRLPRGAPRSAVAPRPTARRSKGSTSA
jgi:hypothetical protein